MGRKTRGEIVFEFNSDERGISAEVQVYRVTEEEKLEHIATVRVSEIRNLARIFE